jgi:hypothetical protein
VVSKDAETEWFKEYTWTILKSVLPASHSGFLGDSFTSEYNVFVDQTIDEYGYRAFGTITVINPRGDAAMTVDVADAVNGTAATINCGDGDGDTELTVAASGTASCIYTVDLGSTEPLVNTATVSFNGGSFVATADVIFGLPTIVGEPTINVTDYFNCVDLADPDSCELVEAKGPVSDDFTFTYPRAFECSSNAADYEGDGFWEDSIPNRAKIDETGDYFDANVDLDCYAPLVSKDADTVWYERYDWTITKYVNPYEHFGYPGNSFESGYEVFVDQTVTSYGWQAFGTITVTNPNPHAPMPVSVFDSVDGVVATLDCGGSLNVPAGGKATCGYTVDLSSTDERVNTAIVTFAGSNFSATAAVVFGAPTIDGFPVINVDDYFNGGDAEYIGSASGDDTFSYDRDFVCPTDEGLYTNGVYTASFPNTAKIRETYDSDDANVDITCYWPADAKVIKVILDENQGPEDIGVYDFEFELRNPDGVLIEPILSLNAAGEVTFPYEFTADDNGTWTITEVRFGWTPNQVTCSFTVNLPADAGETYVCTFDNTENSRVRLLKLLNGDVGFLQEFTFALYKGADGFGPTAFATSSTLSLDPDGFLDFDFGPPPGNDGLNPDAAYTLCELNTPAGWGTHWLVDADGDGVAETTVVPYNPDEDNDPPEDFGNRCVDVGAGTTIPLQPGTTLTFSVDNTYPGGNPRTPGYWKNWNTCTLGGQADNAERNGGWEEGFWLLDDVLNGEGIGDGIVWDDMIGGDVGDGFLFPITDCEEAVLILDKRDLYGDKVAADPLHNLATHLLAAQLNFAAGACMPLPEDGYGDPYAEAMAAELLLDTYDFDGYGHDLDLKKKKDPAVVAAVAEAYELAGYLDDYNNGMFCGDTME